MAIKCHPYQLDLINRVAASFGQHKAILLQAPTGAGKTVCCGEMSRRVAQKHGNKNRVIALYVVHRRELVRQVEKTLRAFGLGDIIGIIQSGVPETPSAQLQIASVQTLNARLDKLKWLDPLIVFVDEAHHIRARTWETVIDKYEDAYLVGLTATPARLDGKGLGKYFTHMVEGPSMGWLAKNGYLCEMESYSLPMNFSMKGVRKSMGDYSRTQVSKKMGGTVIARAVSNWQRLAKDRRTINFAITVEKSKDFIRELKAMGVACEHVDGTTPTHIRDAIFRKFESGDIQVVSNVDLISEGFDCPACDCVLDGAPTASMVRYKQRVGRGMRVKPDGGKGLYIDLAGNLDRHGEPQGDVDWSLEHGIEVESVKQVKFKNRTCNKCRYVYPYARRDCPNCGYEPSGRTVIEQDVNVVRRNGSAAKPEKTIKKPSMNKREIMRRVYATGGDQDKMEALRTELGYNPKVIYVWKSIFADRWSKHA